MQAVIAIVRGPILMFMVLGRGVHIGSPLSCIIYYLFIYNLKVLNAFPYTDPAKPTFCILKHGAHCTPIWMCNVDCPQKIITWRGRPSMQSDAVVRTGKWWEIAVKTTAQTAGLLAVPSSEEPLCSFCRYWIIASYHCTPQSKNPLRCLMGDIS